MSEHIFKPFDAKLDKLITTIVKMGSLAQDQIEVVLNALETGNLELAKFVISRDAKIDKYDVKIEKQCMTLFALQHPVALDLRIILSALSINRDIERIGDHVVNIAEKIIDLQESDDALQKTTLLEMGRKAEAMVVNVLDAFMNRDVELARTVIKEDDAVDALDSENLSTIIDLMNDKVIPIPVGVSLISINRNFERLADEATNIAEEVIFVVDAVFIRHKSSE